METSKKHATVFTPLLNTIFFLALLLVLLRSNPVLAASPLVIGAADSYPLGGASMEVLRDPGRGLTIADIVSPRYANKFVPVRHEIPNFGMTDDAFWFRFTVDVGKRGDEKWLLLLEQPLMNQVDLYVPRNDGGFDVKRAGGHIPMSRREIREREIVLSLPQGSVPRTLYLRTWIAGRAQMPLTILTREEFLQRKTFSGFLFGAYTSFMLLTILSGLFLFALLRDHNYLLYAFIALTFLLIHLGLNGYLYWCIVPGRPLLHEYLVSHLCVTAVVAGLLFARRFLRLAEFAPALHRMCGWLIMLNLLMLSLSHAMPILLYKKLVNGEIFFVFIMTLAGACISYRRGFAPALFYAYGRITLFISGFVCTLANEGFLPVNVITKNVILLSSVGDILFIMLALGHHIILMQRQVATLVTDLEQEVTERTAAHRALKEQMEEKRRLEQEIQQVSREERRHISHKLHDGLCQQLTGANLRFAALEDRLSDAGLLIEAQPLGALLRDTVDHAYALSRRLLTSEERENERAPDLDELTRQLSARSNIPIRLDLEKGCPVCSAASMLHIHLIAREALVNAVKHSAATLITVSLHCALGQGIRLEVRDNGRGIAGPKGAGGGLGIGMMEYRAAKIGACIEITDAEGGGTSVVCAAPCAGAPFEEAGNG